MSKLRFPAWTMALAAACLILDAAAASAQPKCLITGPGDLCGGKAVLCGPEGDFEYVWSGPGGFVASSRCIDVAVAGTYELTLIDAKTKESEKCDWTIETCDSPKDNCPRTVGFWGQQCPSVSNGARKFTQAQMAQITACVDERAAAFDWSDDWRGFCAVLNPAGMDQRIQAKRQFAGMLANLCVGGLGLIARNGDRVTLDPSTVFDCGGESMTIGDFAAFADAELVRLEGQSLTSEAVKRAYTRIIDCADRLNNGIGIGELCVVKKDVLVGAGTSRPASEETAIGSTGAAFGRPSPNPFRESMSVDFSVSEAAGADVDVAVFDLSGRRLATLASGFRGAGLHQASWDGRDASGRRAGAGVYFVRGRIGSQQVGARVMVVK